ncbi:replicative DNA helicase [Inquilinus sp.]|uniref:replicative DNA helicase n=1 Tax=Inquilinus sp. TaxID=1932117 RepID=UPI0031D793DC
MTAAVTPLRRPGSARVGDAQAKIDELQKQCLMQDVEESLISAILGRPQDLDSVADMLQPQHFGFPALGRMYGACLALAQAGRRIDPLALLPFFEADDALSDVGGAGYIMELAGEFTPSGSITEYARVIVDMWKRRQALAAISAAAVAIAYPEVVEPADAPLAALAGELETLQTTATARPVGPRPLASVMHEFQAFLAEGPERRRNALNTGLADLDTILGGIMQPDLVILGARPGMGKSTLMRHVTRHVAHRGKRSVVFTCEMSGLQVGMGYIQRETGVAISAMKGGTVPPADVSRMVQIANELASLPIEIDDASGLTVDQLHRRVRRLQQTGPVDLVCVDYLQLMRDQRHRGSRDPNRVQEVSAISEGLKAAAKDLQVPILALSQLSRALESRQDKRPLLSDLRESGSLEQDADIVAFLYREEVYAAQQQPADTEGESFTEWMARADRVKNLAEIIVAKNRWGETGVAKVRFDGARGLFENLAQGFQGEML